MQGAYARIRKSPFLLLLIAVVAAGVIAALAWFPREASAPAAEPQYAALRAFVTAANEASGIESGAAFDYAFAGYGNPANFGIMRCRDGVRCDAAIEREAAKFEQPNQPPDTAEVDIDTNAVISFHRAIPAFDGGELPQAELERKVRDFLARAYPDFAAIEPSLTFAPGMKGVRLNNGNYFFRWNDDAFELPDGLSADVPPFVQVSITAGGFIFGYDNTIPLYRDALADR